jgi:hypothetical protein
VADAVSEQDLQELEAELRRLEAEYNMFFAGRLPRPPSETRRRIDTMMKRFDRGHMQNYAHRFRLTTLQSRYASFADLWDRGLRAREEGRTGPFVSRRADPPPAAPAADGTVYVAAFRDPTNEMDKLREMYNCLVDARGELGLDPVPFHRFVDLVREQVAILKAKGNQEVTFRVAVLNGKVSFTARATKGE